jgi:hypothetical protein
MRADWWPWWVSTGVALVVVGVALLLLVRSRTSRMRIVMCVVLAAALVAAVAAPFVMGPDDRLTKEEYARKADANCEAFNRFAATLGPANTLPETERYMNRLLPEFRKAVENQGDLVPPESEQRAAGQWMDAMEALGHDFEDIRDAAQQGDQSGVVAANGRSAGHIDASTRLSKQLGLRVCFS